MKVDPIIGGGVVATLIACASIAEDSFTLALIALGVAFITILAYFVAEDRERRRFR